MPQGLTIPDSPHAKQTVLLEDTEVTIETRFNTRNNSWYMSLYSPEGEAIITGIKIIPNQNLTWRYNKKDLFPSGNLWCIRLDGEVGEYVDKQSLLDGSYEIWYFTELEEVEFGIRLE